MARFTDSSGREWILTVNVNAVRRVKEATGEDITQLAEGGALFKVSRDACLLGKVLWSLVEPKAGEVKEEDFLESLSGEALEKASEAFLEALVDFFPPSRREMLRKLIALAKRELEKAMVQANEFLEAAGA